MFCLPGSYVIITQHEIGQNLSEFRSYLGWNDGFHRETALTNEKDQYKWMKEKSWASFTHVALSPSIIISVVPAHPTAPFKATTQLQVSSEYGMS